MAFALEGQCGNRSNKSHVQFSGFQAGGKFSSAGKLDQINIQAFFLEITFFPGDKAQKMSCGVQVAEAEICFFRLSDLYSFCCFFCRGIFRGWIRLGDQCSRCGCFGISVGLFGLADAAAVIRVSRSGQEKRQQEKNCNHFIFHISDSFLFSFFRLMGIKIRKPLSAVSVRIQIVLFFFTAFAAYYIERHSFLRAASYTYTYTCIFRFAYMS